MIRDRINSSGDWKGLKPGYYVVKSVLRIIGKGGSDAAEIKKILPYLHGECQ